MGSNSFAYFRYCATGANAIGAASALALIRSCLWSREVTLLMSAIRVIRRHLRPLRRWAEHLHVRMLELPFRYKQVQLGSADWLARTEIVYGGYVTDVPRRKVSIYDGRSTEQLTFGGMTGGDRMLHHGYGMVYARYLAPFLRQPGLTVAEFGILKGTGLAIWCDLFPNARIIGFDIDLAHFLGNRASLERRGAFKNNSPELYEFDQLVPDSERLAIDLKGAKLDIVIDDGLHSKEAIIAQWRAVQPHLASCFVYFIEDYEGLLDVCGDEFASFDAYTCGLMTVVSRGMNGI